MAVKAKLHRLEGGEGEIELPEALVEGPVHKDLLYRAVVSYLTNRRQGTHATKTRAMVAGSGRKIWPQKYTGRARHGDRYAPIFVGGGVAHGPQPKDYEHKLPKKMRRGALLAALRDRFQSERVVLLDKLAFERPKTKQGLALLERLGIPKDATALIVVSQQENTIPVKKSFSNLPGVECVPALSVHPYEILRHEWLLLTAGALQELLAQRLPGRVN